ncbi:murein biosynthesis integral membrane protein MurJ [Thioalkalicoccus limnaeus]|uniref:Probable lipid II flippase MurJ n=1 Tax=Thioalkalicoccus limnaeus TaxID=120681 RepID=A0ABV4BDH9_9GAMM
MPSLTASIAQVGGNTLLSRLLGFARDLVIARLFGADGATDAFFVAFKIPNFLRRLFTEGAFSAALVPVLEEYRQRRSFADLKGLVDSLAGTLGLALLLITALGVLAAPPLLLAFAPGFAGDLGQRELTTEMLRLTFPYLLFIGLTALAGGLLNTFERFGVPSFTPVLLNLILIGCAVWLAPQMPEPIVALAWGVLIAGIMQLAFQLPFLARLRLLPRPRVRPRDPGVRRIAGLMGPALLGVSVTQINLLLDTLLASFLVAGSISWLYYSDRLVEFPLGLLGVALGVVILPRLSRRYAAETPQAFSHTLDWALRWVLMLGVPAGTGLVVLAGPLIATLFHSSEFGASDVAMTSYSLMAYAVGLVAFMAIKVLVPGYYARQDMAAPVRIALIALAANLLMSLALMAPLGHAGLALATSLAAGLNAVLLLLGLMRAGIYRPEAGWAGLCAKVGSATILMGGLLHLGAGPTADWLALGGLERVARLFVWILLGGFVYLATLWLLGIRPRHLLHEAESDR